MTSFVVQGHIIVDTLTNSQEFEITFGPFLE